MRRRLAVLAHYSDGTVEDVTRRAQYEAQRDTYGHLLWALANSQGFQFNY